MFADTEAEVAGLGEVSLSQLVFLDLEATLEDLLSLGASDGNVDGNLFVTTDTEGTDGVTRLACEEEEICVSLLFSVFCFLLSPSFVCGLFFSLPRPLISRVRLLSYCKLGFDRSIVPRP